MTIEELHKKLIKSQDSYYGLCDLKYRMSNDEHWRTWDLMWELEKQKRRLAHDEPTFRHILLLLPIINILLDRSTIWMSLQ